jgi:hypothetical protein
MERSRCHVELRVPAGRGQGIEDAADVKSGAESVHRDHRVRQFQQLHPVGHHREHSLHDPGHVLSRVASASRESELDLCLHLCDRGAAEGACKGAMPEWKFLFNDAELVGSMASSRLGLHYGLRSQGFIVGQNTYMMDSWNVLDFATTLTSLISLEYPSVSVARF